MPSFAELKAKAAKAKDSSLTSIQNTRDRYSSVPLKNTNWDPYSKQPPPPPPAPRTSVSSPPPSVHASGPPPPVARRSRPPVPARHVAESEGAIDGAETEPTSIDWANLLPEDKEVFFQWLDEFFSRHLNISIPPRSTNPSIKSQAAPVPPRPQPALTPARAQAAPPPGPPGRGPPPPVAKWSRPHIPAASPGAVESFTPSHPPPTQYGSAALDLAYYFTPDAYWDEAWYDTDDLRPPPLRGSGHITYTFSWQSFGIQKTISIGVLFSDLSICWASVEYQTSANADPNDSARVRRSVQYLPCPAPLPRAALLAAHETYGETIAAFAESFEGTGAYCARGECWDLANDALKQFAAWDYVPPPVPSLSRTHGHLLYAGRRGAGRWRGGDDRVRRGDIVEWRKVRITRAGGWALLGDPDHTAVIVSDAVPTCAVHDGAAVTPAQIVRLEVIEQSVGKPPSRAVYELAGLEEGEMWIYRPVGMEEYLGVKFGVKCPDGVRALSI